MSEHEEAPAPTVSFVVPGEPMPKERAEPTIGKRKTEDGTIKHFAKFRPGDRTAEYERIVRLVATAARPSDWPRLCRYRVDIVIYRSQPGDIDNYTKSLLDGVNPIRASYKGKGANKRVVREAVPGVLWLDDRRVYEASQRIEDVEPKDARLAVIVVATQVRCKNQRCGHALTYYPDEQGRCEACQERSR